MDTNETEVHPMNLAIIDAFLSGTASEVDVLDYLCTLMDNEVRRNFRESLELELNESVAQIQNLLDIKDGVSSRGMDTEDTKMRDGKPLRMQAVINTVVKNYEELAKLYAYLIRQTVSTGSSFDYNEL